MKISQRINVYFILTCEYGGLNIVIAVLVSAKLMCLLFLKCNSFKYVRTHILTASTAYSKIVSIESAENIELVF